MPVIYIKEEPKTLQQAFSSTQKLLKNLGHPPIKSVVYEDGTTMFFDHGKPYAKVKAK